MEAIQSVITFMQNLGAACMMPIFVFIIGLIVRVPLKQLLKASVTVGCGFIGTFMVMDLLAEYIGPISTGLVENSISVWTSLTLAGLLPVPLPGPCQSLP